MIFSYLQHEEVDVLVPATQWWWSWDGKWYAVDADVTSMDDFWRGKVPPEDAPEVYILEITETPPGPRVFVDMNGNVIEEEVEDG